MEAITLTTPIEETPEVMHIHEAVTAGGGVRPVKNEAAQKEATEEKQEAKAEITESQLADIAEKMNQVSTVFNTSLAFTVDKPTGKPVIKVMDVETEEIIRQIPGENMLKLMSNMKDVLGMLLDVEM